jgi:hypothetical protein
MKSFALLFLVAMSLQTYALAGEFTGELKLVPEGCQHTNTRICKLKGLLTYKSSQNGLVWQTDEWEDENGESGTTDGASIPGWAQPIIGDPYDPSYLKAAIVHDHYCYKENHVRSWRETHRMFYDALVDLGVGIRKAKIMYFAVYFGGPRWVKLVPGENCGANCIKNVLPSGERWEGDRFGSKKFKDALGAIQATIDENPNITLDEIEAFAQRMEPDSFFFKHGNSYVPQGPIDPNAFPAM